VDHHDALSTHATDKDGATFLFYGPTDVLTIDEFQIQCIELADLIGDDESFLKYLEEYGGSLREGQPEDEYATASAWNALNKSEGL
jgi:hypothetical protein